jgi:predicted dehydrogenase
LNPRARTAIIGCGKVAHLHAAALGRLSESEFVAACDVEPARARCFADLYQVRRFTDCAGMIASRRVEALVV